MQQVYVAIHTRVYIIHDVAIKRLQRNDTQWVWWRLYWSSN